MNKLDKLFGNKKKGKKVIGVDITMLFNGKNGFINDDHKGYASKTDYNLFWNSMKDNSRDVDVYIHLLVQYLLGYMTGKEKLSVPAQVLLNTINFLTLRHSSKQSKPVKDILTKWNTHRQKYDDIKVPDAKDVLSVLVKQRVEGKDGLDSLVIQCHQFYSHDEFAKIADYYQYPTIKHIFQGDISGLKSGDKVCVWDYLKRLAIHNDASFKSVISHTISKLKGIPGVILLLPKLAEMSLLALIFMMRQLISYTRVPDEIYLNQSISNLKAFYMWPLPYGTQAKDLLLRLKREKIAPGYALIQKIWKESFLPEIILTSNNNNIQISNINNNIINNQMSNESNNNNYNNNNNNNNNNDDNNKQNDNENIGDLTKQDTLKSQSNKSTKYLEYYDDEDTFRPLYYLFSKDDDEALLKANIMKVDSFAEWGDNYQVNTGVSPYACGTLILNIIGYDCGYNTKEQKNLEKSIKKLNENEIIVFYKSVIDIFKKSMKSKKSDIAKNIRKTAFKSLMEQIIEHGNDKDEDEDEALLESYEFKDNYFCELPTLHHTGIECDLKNIIYPTPGQMASGESTYPTNEVLSKLTGILTHMKPLIINNNDDNDEDIDDEKKIDNDNNNNDKSKKKKRPDITLRFMIAGGNNILNALCSAYASLYRHGQFYINNFNLEFFILPYSNNTFSQWLARQDPWYNRHIYLPLQSGLYVIPSMKKDEIKKVKGIKKLGTLHTVGKFYRDMSVNYSREADQIVPLMLWEVHCWENKPFTQTPHKLIPFFDRIEIGKKAEYLGQEKLYSTKDEDDDNKSEEEFDEDDIEHSIKHKKTYSQSESDLANFSDADLKKESKKTKKEKGNWFKKRKGTLLYNEDTPKNNQENDNENENIDDDYEQFQFELTSLDLQWTPVDMIGNAHSQTILQANQMIDKLTVASVPRYGDEGLPSSPNMPGVISLYAKVVENKKTNNKYKQYSLLRNEPSHHIRSIEITATKPNERFWILIDDVPMGPFEKIKIRPMMDAMTKTQIYVPIKTFFPVQDTF